MIKLNTISKRYKKTQALDAVTCQLNPAKVTGLIGPNGSGKSTMIKILLGLTNDYEGEVKSSDLPITEISLAGEAADLPESYTASHSLELFCLVKGASSENAERLVKRLGLEEHLSKNIKSLSQGNRQRLNIAIALLGNSKYIILDEPNNGLDPAGFVLLRELILEFKQLGIGFLVASHLLNELEGVCDELIFLKNGKLVLQNTKEELLSEYGTLEKAYIALM